ncbi:MAG: hypothetical protein IPL79_03455 [Myxococcales bacterium]|nr:hypothetical protein [Myxococcales bacterium]
MPSCSAPRRRCPPQSSKPPTARGLRLAGGHRKGSPSSSVRAEDAADTAYEVVELTIEAPSSFRTKAGVGIGSSADEVKAAYGRDLNTDDSSAELLVVGDLYGGAIFSIENNQVKSIFIGAAGE